MNDDELTGMLTQALTLTASDRERLSADFAHRLSEAERDALLWQVVHQALGRFQEQLTAVRSHTYPTRMVFLKGI